MWNVKFTLNNHTHTTPFIEWLPAMEYANGLLKSFRNQKLRMVAPKTPRKEHKNGFDNTWHWTLKHNTTKIGELLVYYKHDVYDDIYTPNMEASRYGSYTGRRCSTLIPSA